MKRMEITARIYSSYKLTYSNIYKDVVSRLYPGIDPESIRLEVEDISDNGRRSIQGQRNLKKYVSRTIRVCEDGRLAHIVGISNTNYDLDKKREKELDPTQNMSTGAGITTETATSSREAPTFLTIISAKSRTGSTFRFICWIPIHPFRTTCSTCCLTANCRRSVLKY